MRYFISRNMFLIFQNRFYWIENRQVIIQSIIMNCIFLHSTNITNAAKSVTKRNCIYYSGKSFIIINHVTVNQYWFIGSVTRYACSIMLLGVSVLAKVDYKRKNMKISNSVCLTDEITIMISHPISCHDKTTVKFLESVQIIIIIVIISITWKNKNSKYLRHK